MIRLVLLLRGLAVITNIGLRIRRIGFHVIRMQFIVRVTLRAFAREWHRGCTVSFQHELRLPKLLGLLLSRHLLSFQPQSSVPLPLRHQPAFDEFIKLVWMTKTNMTPYCVLTTISERTNPLATSISYSSRFRKHTGCRSHRYADMGIDTSWVSQQP